MWATLEEDPTLSVAALARRTYGSFARLGTFGVISDTCVRFIGGRRSPGKCHEVYRSLAKPKKRRKTVACSSPEPKTLYHFICGFV
jgi:hypothetical protein